MRNILKGLLNLEEYRFPDASELQEEPVLPDFSEEAEGPETPPGGEAEPGTDEYDEPQAAFANGPEEGGGGRSASQPESGGPVQYAQLQAELLLRQAREEAEQIVAEAKAAAKQEQESIRAGARDEGYREGYTQGIAQAMDDAARDREAVAQRLEGDVQSFLEKADMARSEVIQQTQDELLDLCIAIAEKVVRVSLKSSSEVIVRMIQTATERLKRQEWVHIYISGCDTKGMAQISPALTTALGALSQHIKIIPMGDDEGGTCIVETPEEIIDASVSTQMANIRDLLRDQMGTI
ncbi:MAG: F0F1 ATP synthase subunit delta [Oscillospiraceae bacterium]|nr:F0F1 ATP synthase subunit delta [Oscillospiraceae bacterium]